MNSEKFAVVFDTNSYRNLNRDTSIEGIEASIAQLKEKESQKNIIAKATPVVGLEMLANLAGPGKSLHYDDCLKGLIAMANHCCEEAENTMHIIPLPYLHLAINFFEVSPTAVELKTRNMAGVIGDFKIDYLKAIKGHQFADTFTKIKDYLGVEEARWIEEVESFVELSRREALKSNPSINAKDLRDKMLEFIDSGLCAKNLDGHYLLSCKVFTNQNDQRRACYQRIYIASDVSPLHCILPMDLSSGSFLIRIILVQNLRNGACFG